jgi:hypothetical protein
MPAAAITVADDADMARASVGLTGADSDTDARTR